MKLLDLVILLVLSITSGVLAQGKTLKVVKASFRALPNIEAPQTTADPEVEWAVLNCIIEEDNIPFQVSLQTSDLERLLSDVQFVSFFSRSIEAIRTMSRGVYLFCFVTLHEHSSLTCRGKVAYRGHIERLRPDPPQRSNSAPESNT